MKRMLIYFAVIIGMVFAMTLFRNLEYLAMVGLIKVGLFVAVLLGILHLLYYLLPYRMFTKVRHFSLFPKYHLVMESYSDQEKIKEKMVSLGYKEVVSKENTAVYSHGFFGWRFLCEICKTLS